MSVSGCHVSVTNQDDINSMLDMLGGLHTAFIWQNLSARFFLDFPSACGPPGRQASQDAPTLSFLSNLLRQAPAQQVLQSHASLRQALQSPEGTS